MGINTKTFEQRIVFPYIKYSRNSCISVYEKLLSTYDKRLSHNLGITTYQLSNI